jgi:hypothetical protein
MHIIRVRNIADMIVAGNWLGPSGRNRRARKTQGTKCLSRQLT